MASVPKPRKPGQVGGAGGHGRNMHNAQKRDQRPKDKGDGCLGTFVLMVGLGLATVLGAGYGAVSIIT